MADLLTADLVRLDADLGADKHAVIRALAEVAGDAGRAGDPARVAEDAFAREATSPTGLPNGVAIPHCRSAGVEQPFLAFARLGTGVDFGAPDGPADLVVLLAAPLGRDDQHLTILTRLARALVKPAFLDSLREAGSSTAVARLMTEAVGRI
jgi:PTS system fructose-specific IIC component